MDRHDPDWLKDAHSWIHVHVPGTLIEPYPVARLPWAPDADHHRTSVRSWVESWARRNGCRLIDPAVESAVVSGSMVETTAYRKCRAGGDVVLQVIEGGGHDRPQSPGSDATAQALSFFASHPFPPMSSADTRFLRIAFPSATLPLARAFELN